MVLKNLRQQPVEIPKGKKLTEEQLKAIKWACLSPEFHGKIDKKQLTIKQKRQIIAYAMKEAEEYPSSHSMRYTILRDVTKTII